MSMTSKDCVTISGYVCATIIAVAALFTDGTEGFAIAAAAAGGCAGVGAYLGKKAG